MSFRPVKKLMSSTSGGGQSGNRDSITSGSGSSRGSIDSSERQLHIATPAKTLRSFFSSSSSSPTSSSASTLVSSVGLSHGSPAPPRPPKELNTVPPVPSIPNKHLPAHLATRVRAPISAEAKIKGTVPVVAKKGSTIRLVGGAGGDGESGSINSMLLPSRASSDIGRRSVEIPGMGSGSNAAQDIRQQSQHLPDRTSDEAYRRSLIVETQGWIGNGAGDEDLGKDIGPAKETVVVTIRVRPIANATNRNPLPPSQADDAGRLAWSMPQEVSARDGTLGVARSIRLADNSRKEWWFDQILPPQTTNKETYLTSALPLIRSAMQGYNSVVFAYGQTASGKSHTITGTPNEPGVIPLSVEELFRIIKREDDREWVLRASYLELYNENLFDLLGPSSSSDAGGAATKNEIQILNGKKDGEVQISGLTEMVVTNVSEVKRVLALGESRRRTGCTDWNERSSRSHSVFRIVIESRSKGSTGEEGVGGANRAGSKSANKATRISCLSLIDLAGSEKATASKERNAEGRHINQSLLTLKNVISKLAEQTASKKSGHIPYRDSKLTRLLQPSLSGDAKISVICTINPSYSAVAESQSTLAFAAGIKRVVLSAKQTEVVDPAALIQQYQNEIAELKSKLAAKDAQGIKEPTGNRRMTTAEKEDHNKTTQRLALLRRLILTSTSVEEEEQREQEEALQADPSDPKIDTARSTFSLQEELHIAVTKIDEKDAEIERLKNELKLRPVDPDARCAELQLKVDQLTFVCNEYESGLLEPQQKVREDVEAEWVPKVQALESRAAEKEKFYKDLYDSVHTMKAEISKLRDRNDRLTTEKKQIQELLHDMEGDSAHGVIIQPALDSKTSVDDGTTDAGQENVAPQGRGAARNTSLSVRHLNSKMTSNVAQKGMGLRSVQEDSMFDLAKRAADFDNDFF